MASDCTKSAQSGTGFCVRHSGECIEIKGKPKKKGSAKESVASKSDK